MLNLTSPTQQEVLADEAEASSSAACKKIKKQQRRATQPHKQQQQQQHCQPSQQHQVPAQQQLPSGQLSVATACLLQGRRSQCVDESVYSEGLAEALRAAHVCKEYLQRRLFAEAIVALVSAFAKSTFCLAVLQDTAPHWPVAMAKARHTTYKEYGQTKGLPHVVKAAEMVLLGFKLLPDPNPNEIRSLFEERVFLETKWKDLCEAQGVSVQDTEWVQSVGAFKTAYSWVMRIQDQQNELSMLELDVHLLAQLAANESLSLNLFMYTIHEMRSKRPSHPLTLAALNQVRMMQDQLDPANQDCMSMRAGFSSAFAHFHDPASAMNHLLMSSYIMLQLCVGKPDEEMAATLRWAAGQIMRTYKAMKRQPGMWECVEVLLLPSMFTLAHVFPLASILGEQDDLLLFINQQHKIQHDELLRQQGEEQGQ